MGTKPGIALIGVVLTGITLSGCESCATCRASKLWGQDKATVSASQTGNPNSYPASAWGNQARIAGNPVNSTGPALPMSQSARIADPGMNSGATISSLNPGNNQATSQTALTGLPTNADRVTVPNSRASEAADARFPATSQTPAQYTGLPSSQTSTGGIDPNSRFPNSSTAPAAAPQPAWPSPTPAGGGTGMKTPEPPPVNTPQTRESSYPTRYPDLQPSTSVPTMPKPGQSPNQ